MHIFFFLVKLQLLKHVDGTECDRVNNVSVPLSLVSDFTERVGSQSCVHVYFKIQGF